MAGIARMGVEQGHGYWTIRTGRIRLLNQYLNLSLIYLLLNVIDQYTRDVTLAFRPVASILEAEDLEFDLGPTPILPLFHALCDKVPQMVFPSLN